MIEFMEIRSVSFDTSFLLHDKTSIDKVINLLTRDNVPCFITSTVVSELEQLKVWGRISKSVYKRALKRWKQSRATVIDFKNRLFSNAFSNACIHSMEEHHGVKPVDISNDCNILVSALKNGVDLFLSEDYHFTSQITRKVISEVKNAACREYNQMCNSNLYSIDAFTFLKAYNNGKMDLDIIQSNMKPISKAGKRL
jgi:rRNA-processing protein FCF1